MKVLLTGCVAALLLLAYEREYPISLDLSDGVYNRCGLDAQGWITSIKLENNQ